MTLYGLTVLLAVPLCVLLVIWARRLWKWGKEFFHTVEAVKNYSNIRGRLGE